MYVPTAFMYISFVSNNIVVSNNLVSTNCCWSYDALYHLVDPCLHLDHCSEIVTGDC